ncbi:MAG: hypothetical protein HY666_00815 [Chloroflexi bacterium]|nr:hypothetical protein [Chloroflexota bacterium]
MEKSSAPNYAVFEDYRSSQGIAVVVRWFMLATWLTLINIRTQESNLPYLNTMGTALSVTCLNLNQRTAYGSISPFLTNSRKAR